MARRKLWSKAVQEHGIEVRLFERRRGGPIWREVKLGRAVSDNGTAYTRKDRKSLGHSDKVRAESEAKALCEALAAHRLTGAPDGRLTLGALFAAYRAHRLPSLSPARQREAASRIAMFTAAWGPGLHVTDVDATRVEAYANARRSLEVVSPGLRTDDDGARRRGYRKPRPIRDGGLDAEFRWLSSVFNWACGYRQNGRRLLAENPLRGIDWPKERNPRRPVASHQRYTATQEHTDAVDPEGRLRCILALARYTGRRESALCTLNASDLLLSAERVRAALADSGMDERLVDYMPHGAIRWRAEADKQGFLFISPISRDARAELDLYLRRNPRLGDVPLFPAPGIKVGRRRRKLDVAHEPQPEKPMRRETVARWLVKAEELAELPKLRGGAFHPYRRLWATERKHMPDVDVAAAGGWKDTQALRLSYQAADPASVLRVVEGG